MPTRTEYANGIPCWVDLNTNDPAAAERFYGELFGWEFEDSFVEGQAASGYSIGRLKGKAAAGIGAQGDGDPMPSMWSLYLASDDVDAGVAAATEAGASVLAGPMDIPPHGRMAFVQDPAGAAVGLWQAGEHLGCEIVNEDGAFVWCEVQTDDNDAIDAFYPVLGATFEDIDFGGGMYHAMKVGDRTVGGSWPLIEGVPPNWHVYFAVDDCDASTQVALDHGATALNGPMDTPAGRMTVLRDPVGAVFSIIQMTYLDD